MHVYLPIAGLSLHLGVLAALGLSVGILSGIFGVGGGFILTPLLIVLGVPPLIAVGTGASIVVAASVAGAFGHWQRKNVDLVMGLLLVGSGLVGSTLGSALQKLLQKIGQLDLVTTVTYVAVLTVIGTVMLVEGSWAWRRSRQPIAPTRRRTNRQRAFVQKLPLRMRFRRSKMYISVIPPLAIGAFVGLLTALMGAGGGFILIPLLIYVLGMNTRIALGTSAFQIIFVASFTTVIQSAVNQNVDIVLGLPLMLGSVIGAQYGVKIGSQLKPEALRILLGSLVLLVGIRMLVDLASTPADLFVLAP